MNSSSKSNFSMFYTKFTVSALVALFICTAHISTAQSPATEKESVIPVFAETVKVGTVSEKIKTSGDLIPMLGVNLNPEASGKIIEIFVDVGSKVKKGDKLAQINDEVQRAQLEQAQAAITVAKATIRMQKVMVKSSKTNLVSAKAALEASVSTLTNLSKTKERLEKLFTEGAVSRQSLDNAITQYDSSVANHTAAQSNVEKAVNAIESALMTLEMRAAELIRANANLNAVRVSVENTVVDAPFDGVISERYVDPGAMASLIGTMFKLEQNDPVKIIGTIIEKDIERIEAGKTEVIIKVDSISKEFRGILKKVYPAVDSKTRTCKIEIIIENDDNLLRTGMFAKLELLIRTHKNVVVTQRDSLIKHENDYYAYIIEDNRAVRRKVKVGITDDGIFEILDGMKSGDIMITRGTDFIREGSLVSHDLGEQK